MTRQNIQHKLWLLLLRLLKNKLYQAPLFIKTPSTSSTLVALVPARASRPSSIARQAPAGGSSAQLHLSFFFFLREDMGGGGLDPPRPPTTTYITSPTGDLTLPYLTSSRGLKFGDQSPRHHPQMSFFCPMFPRRSALVRVFRRIDTVDTTEMVRRGKRLPPLRFARSSVKVCFFFFGERLELGSKKMVKDIMTPKS